MTAKKLSPLAHFHIGWNFQRSRSITQSAEDFFKLLDLGIRFACLVPQVFAANSHHEPSVKPSFPRNSFMPRCRLTRTDAAVSPGRAAISGPVIPSTSL